MWSSDLWPVILATMLGDTPLFRRYETKAYLRLWVLKP